MAEKKNIAASVHQRLYNRSKESGENFNLLLIRFANERWLYRLSVSEHKERFLLKGASLFILWFNVPHRPTRDVDLLGFGSSEIADIETVFKEICNITSDDGLVFKHETVKGAEIKEGQEYQGVRVKFSGFLGKAELRLQVDVGFGDAVTPKAQTVEFPTVLDFPAPELKAYPKETVIAEKFEAMVKLGFLNSRMKDFWDLQIMVREFEFKGMVLQKAIQETFERRSTAFPSEIPVPLTDEFAADKQTQWNAFLRKNKLEGTTNFAEVVDSLSLFFQPLIESSARNQELEAEWRENSWHINE